MLCFFSSYWQAAHGGDRGWLWIEGCLASPSGERRAACRVQVALCQRRAEEEAGGRGAAKENQVPQQGVWLAARGLRAPDPSDGDGDGAAASIVLCLQFVEMHWPDVWNACRAPS